jgi:hypothetical protein
MLSHVLNDGDYRALDIGPVTGRVYVFGNHSERAGLIFTILDSAGMETVETFRITLPPFNWWIYQAGVSTDEQRLFVSYHGSPNFTGGPQGTGGIDWFNRAPDRWTRCLNRSEDGTGCIRAAHGGTEFEVEQNLETMNGARTLAFDAATGNIFVMTVERGPTPPGGRGAGPAIPGCFTILRVGRP